MDWTIIAAILSAAGLIVTALIAMRGKPAAKKGRWPRPKPAALIAGTAFLIGFIGSGSLWMYGRMGAPRVRITEIPSASEGSEEILVPIAGTVAGKRTPGARVVVYAYADGRWFVQPNTRSPFTPVADGAWTTTTHQGTQYAALLVGPGFEPPPFALELPADQRVLASVQVPGRWEGP